MPTAEKAKTIEELSQKLRDSKGAVLLDYRGLNVADITALRRQLQAEEIEFQVAKNTLLRIAADRAEIEVDPELLAGPTAVAFGWRDEVAPARLLSEFARRNRVVQVKGGIVGGHSLDAAQIGRVAELPNRETLLAQLIGVIQAPLAQALGIL
jgi:large subunit ribosomal protein L10